MTEDIMTLMDRFCSALFSLKLKGFEAHTDAHGIMDTF